MGKMANPHDKFFKQTLADISTARDFLANYLPTEVVGLLDLGSLELQKDSYIDKKLRELQSDLLFRAKFSDNIPDKDAYIYILFEHKSYPDRKTGLQLLRYLTAIWEAMLSGKDGRNTAKDGLPIIIPVVVYHGESPWPWGNCLLPLFDRPDGIPDAMKVFIPDFQYELQDFSYRSKPQIRGEVKLRIFLHGLQVGFVNNREEMLKIYTHILQALSSLDSTRDIAEYMETLLLYILEAQDHLNIEDLVNAAENEKMMGGDFVMTTADKLRNEGKLEGKLEAQREIIANMLKIGISEKEVARLTKASLEFVQKVKAEIS